MNRGPMNYPSVDGWIRHTLVKNKHTTDGQDFLSAFSPLQPILTAVVSLNLKRDKQFKVAAQVFVAKDGAGYKDWPIGF